MPRANTAPHISSVIHSEATLIPKNTFNFLYMTIMPMIIMMMIVMIMTVAMMVGDGSDSNFTEDRDSYYLTERIDTAYWYYLIERIDTAY